MTKDTKDAPAFDFYPERFWFAVEGWTESEIVRYWRLLSQQWMRDGLPEAEDELEGLARGKLTARVMSKFPVGEDGKRRNRFLEETRVDQRERRRKSKEKIERMNAARASAHSSTRTSTRDSTSSSCSESTRASCRLPHPSPITHHPVSGSPSAGEATDSGGAIPPFPLETAKRNSGQYGATPECAEKWWLDQDARGWLDGRGQPITRPWSHLQSYAITWRANEAKSRAAPGRPVPAAPRPEHSAQERITPNFL